MFAALMIGHHVSISAFCCAKRLEAGLCARAKSRVFGDRRLDASSPAHRL
jgi:hypothetical protein